MAYGPDEEQIKRHLLHCLEMHYGDLSSAVVQPDDAVRCWDHGAVHGRLHTRIRHVRLTADNR